MSRGESLTTENGVGIPLDTPLRSGESYTTEPVFIVGHENSPLRGKTEFKL